MIHARNDYNRIQDPANLIPIKEPVFLLRAQDSLAAETLDYWAKLNNERGGSHQLSLLAQGQAQEMRRWPFHKSPDLPEKDR
jgi:hypothetical protein